MYSCYNYYNHFISADVKFIRNKFVLFGREANQAQFFLEELIEANPNSISTCDVDGCIPFSNSIYEWIQEVHESCRQPIHFKLFNFDVNNNNLKIPTVVHTDPMVQWSFKMIANTFVLLKTSSINSMLEVRNSSRRLNSPEELCLQMFSRMPLLFKTCLLVNDNSKREQIFGYTYMKRCFLYKHTVGPWLVALLADSYLASRAIEYFEYLSRLTTVTGMGIAKPSASDVIEFNERMEDIISHLAKMDYIIPALYMLSDEDMKRATLTYPVQRILEMSMTTTTIMAILVFDLCAHILLVLSFGQQEYTFLTNYGDNLYDTTNFTTPMAMSTIICIYLFLREDVTNFILLKSFRRIIKKYFSIWELVGIFSLIFVVATNTTYLVSQNKVPTLLYAMTKALVWCRFLRFLKVINVHLTAFINSLGYIIASIRWFLVVMMLNLCMFADIMHLIEVAQFPEKCNSISEDETDVTADLCSRSLFRNVLRTYAIITGDVELDSYRTSLAMTLVWCAFVAVGVIMLLNVLIAIVTKSYAQSNIKRHSHLGKERISSLAKHTYLNSRAKAACSRGRKDFRYWLLLLGILSFLLIYGLSYLLYMRSILSYASQSNGSNIFSLYMNGLAASAGFIISMLSMTVVVCEIFNISVIGRHWFLERGMNEKVSSLIYSLLGMDQNKGKSFMKRGEMSENDNVLPLIKEMIDASTNQIRKELNRSLHGSGNIRDINRLSFVEY